MSQTRKSTKKKTFCEIIGNKRYLGNTNLPNKRDILKYYLWLDLHFATNIISDRISIWDEAGISTISKTRIKYQVNVLISKYKSILKSSARVKTSCMLQKRIQTYRCIIESLFNISKCKCYDVQNCKCPVRIKMLGNENPWKNLIWISTL